MANGRDHSTDRRGYPSETEINRPQGLEIVRKVSANRGAPYQRAMAAEQGFSSK
jgi:hypothetical protein